jgi:hypothetical protein
MSLHHIEPSIGEKCGLRDHDCEQRSSASLAIKHLPILTEFIAHEKLFAVIVDQQNYLLAVTRYVLLTRCRNKEIST